MITVSVRLNGRPIACRTSDESTLLDLLRGELALDATHDGCTGRGLDTCGACTVLVNGEPVAACMTPASAAQGASVWTVEALNQPDHWQPLTLALLTARQAGEPIAPQQPHPAVVGGSTQRVDSLAKVLGQARYAEDIAMPGLLHAAVLRSPYHHARLTGLDTGKARHAPGVAAVITAEDVPLLNGFPEYSKGEPVLVPVGETAPMRGAPVALVVAESPAAAQKALRRIEARYEPLEYTFDAAEALDETAPPIYPGGNLLSHHTVSHGDLDAAFAQADVIVEAAYHTSFQEHAALERETVLAYPGDDGRLTVIGGTHEPHWQQAWIAAMLGLDADAVRVIAPPTGGSFGGKQDPWPLLAAGLMAHLVGQPVLLAFNRAEVFEATPKRHPYDADYRVGATREGRLMALQARITANTGGYDAGGTDIPNYAIVGSGGPYRWQAVDSRARSVITNGPKCGQFRGYGTPQSTFALECTLDEVIEALGADPIAFRLANAIAQDETSFLGFPIAESLGIREVMTAIEPRYRAMVADADAFNAAQTPGSPLRRGVGLAGMWYRFGKSGSLRIDAEAELRSDGGFSIYCSAPDYGQGINTTLTQIAAEALGVERDAVTLINADTARTPDSGVQGASRATYWVGSAVARAAGNLRLTVLATAAELAGCAPDGLTLHDGDVTCEDEPGLRVPLSEVARALDEQGSARRVGGRFDASPLFPLEGRQPSAQAELQILPAGSRPAYTPHFVTGANASEVEVDLETGQVQVLRVAAAHDVGRAINPPDAQGQIEGAVMMGLGTALCEEFRPGVTRGFVDYILPMVDAMPEIEAILVEVPGFHGPLGAKGLGEAAILPTTPAIINAVSRAIGARIRCIPATPERVLAAIKATR